MDFDRDGVGSGNKRGHRNRGVFPTAFVRNGAVGVIVKAGVVGDVLAELFDAINVDRGSVVIFYAEKEIQKDRRIGDLNGGAVVGGGMFVLSVASEAQFGGFAIATITKRRGARCPYGVIESARSPGGSLIGSVIKIFPCVAGR